MQATSLPRQLVSDDGLRHMACTTRSCSSTSPHYRTIHADVLVRDRGRNARARALRTHLTGGRALCAVHGRHAHLPGHARRQVLERRLQRLAVAAPARAQRPLERPGRARTLAKQLSNGTVCSPRSTNKSRIVEQMHCQAGGACVLVMLKAPYHFETPLESSSQRRLCMQSRALVAHQGA